MTDAARSLSDDLDDEFAWPIPDVLPDEPPVPPEPWDVDRMLRRVAMLDEQAAAVAVLAAQRRATIDEWEASRLRTIDGQRAWLARGIEGWMRQANDADPKVKTVNLPHGQVRARPRRTVVDAHEVGESGPVYPEDVEAVDPRFVKVERTVMRNVIAKACEMGAEIEGKADPADDVKVFTAVRKVDDEIVVVPGVYFVVPQTKDYGFTATRSAAL